jgi:ABC-type transport system involved in multi-copper enzyme maturation permease subunit
MSWSQPATTPSAAGAPVTTPPAAGDRFTSVVASEWIKLWSLRSTAWTLATLVVVTIGFSALASWGTATLVDKARVTDPIDVTDVALGGIAFGQLALVVLGVLVISGEYSTGAIRTSLTAVPHRLRFLTAKAAVFTAVAFGVGLITCLASFAVGMTFFASHHTAVSLGDPGVLRAVIGGALYLATSGLLGYAVGVLLRHTAGAITLSVGLLFVAPVVLAAIPGRVLHTVSDYFLGEAGGHITEVLHHPGTLGPWTGYLVFLAECAALLALAAALMHRRDA